MPTPNRYPAIALGMLLLAVSGCARPPTVIVGGERLVGTYHEDSRIAVFRGVPFAEPPVGALRWRAPEPLHERTGSRDATQFADACMQTPRILEWYRDMARLFGATGDVFEDLSISEDCLYLNVWTPVPDASAKLPVMVYVHGGSNSSGWSYEPNYHGHVLAGRGVVLVSIAYRLGVFGFFSHPDIRGNDAVANFGLWDQVAALEWVREHIEAFGGDAGRITVFGESAGSQDIVALMFSESANGLFHRAILQSTAGLASSDVPTLAGEQARGSGLANAVGAADIDALRQVDAHELLAVYTRLYPHHYHAPAVDGQLLKEPTWQSVANASSVVIDVITGSNAEESLQSVPADASRDDVVAAAARFSSIDGQAALGIVAGDDPRTALNRLRTAEDYLCPAQRFAVRMKTAGSGSWMYYFTRVRDGAAGQAVRAYHGAELPYVFGTHDAWLTTTDTDRVLSDAIMTYWTRFAATGNPNASGLPAWPQFGPPGYPVQGFGNDVRTLAVPEPALCALFAPAG